MPEPGLQFKITLDDTKARAAIRGIYLRALSLRIPFEALGKWLVTRQHEHFEAQASPTGVPWKALAPATIAQRTKRYAKARGARGRARAAMSALFGEKILFVHGYLEQSINYRADDTTLAVGTNLKFPGGTKSAGAIHQFGGTAGRGVWIPARPFLGMNREDENHGADILMDYLAKL